MRILISLTLVLCACQPAPPLHLRTQRLFEIPDAPPLASRIIVEPTQISVPSAPDSAPHFARKTIHGILFKGVAFDSRSHRLQVIDQPQGPGSVYGTARDVAVVHDALAAINAGFFTPEGKPLGLVITAGSRSGVWNSASSLGSGIFAESASGQLSISRRSLSDRFDGARELIQVGPLLMNNGKLITRLDQEKLAVRSILITDGNHRWWMGKTSLCTLAALGEALTSASPAAWPARHALNLDGGRSTDLFVSSKITGGPFQLRGILNRPVRNFLLLKAR